MLGYKKNDTQKLHATEMRMLRLARGKTKEDHIKNEDIWREANIKPMRTFDPQQGTTVMVWPCDKEWWGRGYHQEDDKHASAWKEKKREAQEEMAGQHQG